MNSPPINRQISVNNQISLGNQNLTNNQIIASSIQNQNLNNQNLIRNSTISSTNSCNTFRPFFKISPDDNNNCLNNIKIEKDFFESSKEKKISQYSVVASNRTLVEQICPLCGFNCLNLMKLVYYLHLCLPILKVFPFQIQHPLHQMFQVLQLVCLGIQNPKNH